MLMRDPPAVAVKDILPAGVEEPVVIVLEQLAGIPGVPFILVPD